MTLVAGMRLGPYEIVAPLGAGGMGEVYRARDPKLHREVAIKILPDALLDDPERVARFQREAQLLAALNHPHIATIYGLEEAESARFIVREFVDGESLAQRLEAAGSGLDRPEPPGSSLEPRHGLPVTDALAIARQIVDALEAAHEKGIVHRDLKPANIMLTSDGQVKVLDFGLAKFDAGTPGGSGALSHSPTLTFAATQAGMILGTAAYMSPEQARGRVADKRSDIWAFGCVLYEMLAGARAFKGDDATDIIAAVVRADPDWSALPPAVPLSIGRVLRQCLEKDRKARIPDMSVVRFLIADAESASSSATLATAKSPGRSTALVAGVAMAAGAVVAAGAAWILLRQRPAPPPQPARFSIVVPAAQAVSVGGPDRSVVISPDGTRLVYVSGSALGGGGQLFVRDLNQLDPVPVRGITSARAPFISPNGRWIGFFDAGELKRVPMTGGPAITICSTRGGTRGSSWGSDDTIVFATNDTTTGLSIVPAGGGEPRVLTKPDTARGELDHFFPSILPGGRAVLFTVMMTAGSIDQAQIEALDLKTGQRKRLIGGGSHAEYVDPSSGSGQAGYLVYASGGALRAVRFDPERLEVLSDPVVVADQVRTEMTGAAHFSVSRSGALVYALGGGGTAEDRSLLWVDRRGREQPIAAAPSRAYTYPRVSPDGSRIAVSIADQDQDIWVLGARQPLTRLTFGPSAESSPVWTPDGRRLVFSSNRSGIPNAFWQPADGTGTMEQVTNTQTLVVPFTISPDGSVLLVSLAGGQDIGMVRLDDARTIAPLIQAPGIQTNAEISADGHWLAYQSNESGQFQIYVRPFPNVEAGRWQVSSGGGTRPVWARNGRELFYLDGDGSLTTVLVGTTPTFSAGNPTKLFDRRYYAASPGRTFDVSVDGQKFLTIREAPGADRTPTAAGMVVVLNWTEELKQRVPIR